MRQGLPLMCTLCRADGGRRQLVRHPGGRKRHRPGAALGLPGGLLRHGRPGRTGPGRDLTGRRQRGGLVLLLLLLSAMLFLVGGGFAPPILLGVPASIAGTRIGNRLRFWRGTLRGGAASCRGRGW